MPTKDKEKKPKNSSGDTGSAAVQIGLLTEKIDRLSGHFKKFPKDFISKRGFLKMVGRRHRLLNYLKKNNGAKYKEVAGKYKI